MYQEFHKTQVSILHALRYSRSARFSTLMQPTGLTSDSFKFHIQKLVKLGYVTKARDGNYQLTPSGKEFANALDEQARLSKKQPKLSVLLVISKPNDCGDASYLLQQRARQPFYGYWTEITDAVRWGESFEDAANRVLRRQTGLQADISVTAMRRIRDYTTDSAAILEDKLFIICIATDLTGEIHNDYPGGELAWLTLPEIKRQSKVFTSTIAIIESLQNGPLYAAQDIVYAEGEY